ncbi:unnamed protein product [Nesidiocoris tenuis]|uniref:Uncharacterized protein n=1 Tax=Nesidiocoris tenuis TaxID=355587 RepID=A0A6H5HR29_9HEMI|nr:unnamed protein product [Nesidiocoris tenuis]
MSPGFRWVTVAKIIWVCLLSLLGCALASPSLIGILSAHDDGQWRPWADNSALGSGLIQWGHEDGSWKPHLDGSILGDGHLTWLHRRRRQTSARYCSRCSNSCHHMGPWTRNRSPRRCGPCCSHRRSSRSSRTSGCSWSWSSECSWYWSSRSGSWRSSWSGPWRNPWSRSPWGPWSAWWVVGDHRMATEEVRCRRNSTISVPLAFGGNLEDMVDFGDLDIWGVSGRVQRDDAGGVPQGFLGFGDFVSLPQDGGVKRLSVRSDDNTIGRSNCTRDQKQLEYFHLSTKLN